MAKTISVGRTPKSAYDPQRKVSGLIAAQVENLRQVTYRKFGGAMGSKPRTEGSASKYLAEATARLHPQVSTDSQAARAAVGGPTPRKKATKPSSRRAPAKKRSTSSGYARGKRR
jgi:hypothetical protein